MGRLDKVLNKLGLYTQQTVNVNIVIGKLDSYEPVTREELRLLDNAKRIVKGKPQKWIKKSRKLWDKTFEVIARKI